MTLRIPKAPYPTRMPFYTTKIYFYCTCICKQNRFQLFLNTNKVNTLKLPFCQSSLPQRVFNERTVIKTAGSLSPSLPGRIEIPGDDDSLTVSYFQKSFCFSTTLFNERRFTTKRAAYYYNIRIKLLGEIFIDLLIRPTWTALENHADFHFEPCPLNLLVV